MARVDRRQKRDRGKQVINKEAIAIIQVKGKGGLDQCGRSKDGKK